MMQAKDVVIRNGFRNLLALALAIGFSVSIHEQAAGRANLSTIHPLATCAALVSLSLEAIAGAGYHVTTAQETSNNDITVCSNTGTLAPEVNFQALLPLHNRTQRYLQVGWGGLCGNITLRSGASDGCAVLNDGGFVMAATDMGHSGMGADWGQDAQKRSDFACRAQHLTALVSKALIRAFYGQDAAFSYFNGIAAGACAMLSRP